MLFAGFYVGVMTALVVRRRDVVRIWPVWEVVIDFDLVNALLDADPDLPRNP